MNKFLKVNFQAIIEAGQNLKDQVTKELVNYREVSDLIKQKAEKYADPDGYTKERKAPLIIDTRIRIESYYSSFRKTVRDNVKKIEKELNSSMKKPLNADFSAKLKEYKDFGVAPSKTEIAGLLELNRNNPTGLRLLSVVLKETNSEYGLDFKTAEAFESDLTFLNSMTKNLLFVPLEYYTEGMEIFGGQRLKEEQPDGTEKESFTTIDNMVLHINSQSFEYQLESVERMKNSWISDISGQENDEYTSIVKELNELKDQPVSADPVSAEITDDFLSETLGEESGKARAKAYADYQEAMKKLAL